MRTVHCRKFDRELPGLERPPFPGPRGQDIFDHVSAEAWQAWLQHQTTLINEHHLVTTDAKARTYLMEQMQRFLSGADYDQAEGYVAPAAPAAPDAPKAP